MSDKIYAVAGMHCQSCAANIRETVSELTGVAAVDVDLAAEKVTVRGEGFDDDAIRGAIAAAGYQAAPA
jgi:copper chaperone